MRIINLVLLCFILSCFCFAHQTAAAPTPEQTQNTMKTASQFMLDKVSYRGGFVWSYLPDFSRQWGELEARRSMIWMQPPGTSSVGIYFLMPITPLAISFITPRRSVLLERLSTPSTRAAVGILWPILRARRH